MRHECDRPGPRWQVCLTQSGSVCQKPHPKRLAVRGRVWQCKGPLALQRTRSVDYRIVSLPETETQKSSAVGPAEAVGEACVRGEALVAGAVVLILPYELARLARALWARERRALVVHQLVPELRRWRWQKHERLQLRKSRALKCAGKEVKLSWWRILILERRSRNSENDSYLYDMFFWTR